jgi:hypothetical protein
MRSGRWSVLLTVLLVGLLMLSACAPRATGGEVASRAGEAGVAVDLPALVLDIQEDGSLAVGGVPLSDLGALVGQDLSQLTVGEDTAQALAAAGIQHIQIDNTDQGLLILVNGKPIPSLAWDGESLVTTARLVEDLGGPSIALLDKLLPLIGNLGLGVIVRAPVPEGADQLPLVSIDDAAAEEAMSAQAEFLRAVVTPPTFSIAINYAPDGTYELAGISPEDLNQFVPGLGDSISQDPGLIAQMDQMGIDQIGLSTNEDGLFVSINGQNLPYFTWADGRIMNVLNIAVESGMLDEALGGMDPEVVMQYVDALLPALLATDVNLSVNFP